MEKAEWKDHLYDMKMSQLTPIHKDVMIPRYLIEYGIQGRKSKYSEGEYTDSKVLEIKDHVLKYGAEGLKPIYLVVVNGTYVVVDGHHTFRGVFFANSVNPQLKINSIKCNIYDLEEYLKIMNITIDDLMRVVGNAAATFDKVFINNLGTLEFASIES